MKKLSALANYSDELGNVIQSPKVFDKNIDIIIRGSNNKLTIHPDARITKLNLVFDCDNGSLVIGSNTKHGVSMFIRIGQDSTVNIGNDVTTTTLCTVSAVEGATVSFGNDVMIASGNHFRSDDSHPIFDVSTGKRVNPTKDISIGNHVWFGEQAVALAGAIVGDGTVIGFRSIVTRKIPNNCIAVGSPAKVVRKNIAWERPHLSYTAPGYKPDATYVTKTDYWNMTEYDSSIDGQIAISDRQASALRRKLWHLRRSVFKKM